MRKINSNIKQNICFFLLFTAVYLLWGTAVYYGQYVVEHYQSVSIRMKGGTVSQRELMQMVEQEKENKNQEFAGISAWNQVENQSLESDRLGTKAEVRLIEVYGVIEKVYPVELISGYTPAADDAEGCLIDEATAYKLFRTADSVGNALVYKNKTFYVRGILRCSEEVCLIIPGSEEKNYSNLELTFTDGDNRGQLAADLMRQYGSTGGYTLIDGYLIAKSLSLVYRLPAWLLGFILLYDLLAVLWKRRRIPLQVIALVLIIVCLWPLLFWMMEYEFYLPQQLIPTKWSDFSFWSRKYAAFLEWKEAMAYIIPSYRDVLLKKDIRGCLLRIVAAATGMFVLVLHERRLFFKHRQSGSILLIALLECAALSLLFAFGKMFIIPRAYLGMPVFYMLVVGCFRWGEGWIRTLRSSHPWKDAAKFNRS
ncbi:MAG: ABC transporter permease [Lachnospiraceae bacterium]|nr:ABC transporter permease [Lachnospiraceae bacterium]